MKKIFSLGIIRFVLFILILISCENLFGQLNLLDIKDKENYSYNTYFKFDKIYKLLHYIYYDDRNLIDEEFSHKLIIDIICKDSISTDTIYQIKENDGLIKCSYELFSPLGKKKSSDIDGWIKILDWTDDKIVVEMKIDIYREEVHYYSYIGKEEFLLRK
ncbi:MAG: hypothetical protein JW866_11360 [Ignavibacteriales bacterium]|nr:hypothetical protein [Ignavibacteriales bacterium]